MVLRTGKGIAGITLISIIRIVEVVAAVCLHEHKAGFILVVHLLALVDLPDQQTFAGEVKIEADLLPVFEQQILLVPKLRALDLDDLSACRRVGLHRQLRRSSNGRRLDPSVLQLMQGRWMRRTRPIAVIGSACHQIPHAGPVPIGSVIIVVRIVEVLPFEGEVAKLVRADPDLAIVGDRQIDRGRQILRHLDRILEIPFVRPDVLALERDALHLLGAATRMNDKKRGNDTAVELVER